MLPLASVGRVAKEVRTGQDGSGGGQVRINPSCPHIHIILHGGASLPAVPPAVPPESAQHPETTRETLTTREEGRGTPGPGCGWDSELAIFMI
jgi:hypothetical protein